NLERGYCRYFDLAGDPHEGKDLADERPGRVAALRARLDRWMDQHARYEPKLTRGPANPGGEAVPRAIERGRLGAASFAGELAAMLTSDQPARLRREAARLLAVALPARPETRAALDTALDTEDPEVRDWAAVAAARLGDPAARAQVREIVQRP